MRRAHGVDVASLQCADIPQHILARDIPACAAVEFMAVDAFEDNPLAVDAHQLVLHLEPAEAGLLYNSFHNRSVCTRQSKTNRIEIWILCTPGQNIGNVSGERKLLPVKGTFSTQANFPVPVL
ncbi:hypothetical protein D3C75_710310 [compost metagenome]